LHLVSLLIVTIGVAGCAAAPPPPEPPRLVWPPPPAPPRIEFVQNLSSGEDLRSARSAGSWLLDLVGGSSPTVGVVNISGHGPGGPPCCMKIERRRHLFSEQCLFPAVPPRGARG
jgi:hypothetical protein